MSVRDDAITAHGGGELVDLQAPAAERAALRTHAASLPVVTLGARDLSDLEMLASGAFSPLTGFMGEADYTRSRDEMRLASGAPWSIPITLGVEEADRARAQDAEPISRLRPKPGSAWRS